MPCAYCGQPTPRPGQRHCSHRCAGLAQHAHKPRRPHRWGKSRPVPPGHRALRAQLLPAALGALCPSCRHVTLTRDNAELDHIIPRALGGKTTPESCQIICRACNRHKGAVLGGKQAHANSRRTRQAATRQATPTPIPEWHSRNW